jgi:hypothetical protein
MSDLAAIVSAWRSSRPCAPGCMAGGQRRTALAVLLRRWLVARYAPPGGPIVRGWTVQLEPAPGQVARFRRDCGARRFAYNWAVTEISQAFARGRETVEHPPVVWSAWSLRKRWNSVKAEAQSDGKTAPVRRVAVKRVNHPGRVAA